MSHRPPEPRPYPRAKAPKTHLVGHGEQLGDGTQAGGADGGEVVGEERAQVREDAVDLILVRQVVRECEEHLDRVQLGGRVHEAAQRRADQRHKDQDAVAALAGLGGVRLARKVGNVQAELERHLARLHTLWTAHTERE